MLDSVNYDCNPSFVHSCALNASRYTGKERDAESGLDYFGARYYASNMGRWMSPDWSAQAEPVPYSVLDDPQSLNLYQFVRNNPLRNRDSDGHDCPPDCGDGLNDSMAGSPFEGITHTAVFQNTMKFGVGIGLVGTAAVGDAPGSAVGALMVFNTVLGGTSSAVSGATGLIGQATKTDVTEGQAALNATSTGPGLLTTAATGSIKAGEVATTITNVASLAKAPQEAVKNAATTLGAVQTVKDTGGLIQRTVNAVKMFLNPPPPPAPKPPPAPTCIASGACH